MVQGDEVLQRLAADGKIAALLRQHDDGRPREAVVVGGHGVVVGPGGADGDMVAALGVV